MFFFIAGAGPKTILLDREPRTCPRCGCGSLRRQRTDQYLSLFFIPLFPVRKGEPFLVCAECGTAFRESEEIRPGGEGVRGRFCPSCGLRWETRYKYCPECGKPLEDG